jgi:hypothetical protein
MTQTLDPATTEIRDFSKQRTVQFQVKHRDGTPDVYTCEPAIPALLLVDFMGSIDAAQNAQDLKAQAEMFQGIFGMVLDDEQSARIIGRMRDKRDPIDIQQVMDIIQYVMEEYGLRPTTPPGPSAEPSASPGSGTSSEATSSTEASTSDASPLTSSSTSAITTS